MSDIAIKVEGLSKRYLVGHQSERQKYIALRDVIASNTSNLARKTVDMFKGRPIVQGDEVEEFWALKDINFEIKKGDRVGIIGRNGAGKSTLLKILSRITEPTAGRVQISGRVASLLEVGTGFHPELTGRENIYLNGAILGMRRTEIKKKFDEIVAFAEVDRFLDTPVKRYSSGMYVRLAFSVAAHLEPEILIVDEVLAVGDAQFQKKCLGKMEDVSTQDGRTVLFVSHNLPAVENLCKTGMVLQNGSLAFEGRADQSIANYLNLQKNCNSVVELAQRVDRKGGGDIRIVKMWLGNTFGDTSNSIKVGDDLIINIEYESKRLIQNPRVIIGVYDLMNSGITRFDTELASGLPCALESKGNVTCSVSDFSLCPGTYQINVAFFQNGAMQDYLVSAMEFEVFPSDFYKTGKLLTGADANLAKVLFQHKWDLLT